MFERSCLREIPGKKFIILSGNKTTEPYWVRTGTTRCVKDEYGLNIGGWEAIEVNANPASSTYGQERWVYTGDDVTVCPIGEPIDILWGEQLVLDVDGLRSEPYSKVGSIYLLEYSNDDSDVYLWLLHRATMGTIQSISYGPGRESLAAWEYEPDIIVDEYTLKVTKIKWFTDVFQNLNVNFNIN